MKQTSSTLLAVMMMFIISGCKQLSVDKPFGERPSVIKAEEWNGTWIKDDFEVVLKVADTNAGLLRIEIDEVNYKKQSPEYRIAVIDGYARQVNRSMFLTMADPDENGQTNLFWVRALMKPDELLVWIPIWDEFEELVKQGKLPGNIQSNTIALHNLSSEHLNRIEKQTDGKLFDPENPITFRRLKNK